MRTWTRFVFLILTGAVVWTNGASAESDRIYVKKQTDSPQEDGL